MSNEQAERMFEAVYDAMDKQRLKDDPDYRAGFFRMIGELMRKIYDTIIIELDTGCWIDASSIADKVLHELAIKEPELSIIHPNVEAIAAIMLREMGSGGRLRLAAREAEVLQDWWELEKKLKKEEQS